MQATLIGQNTVVRIAAVTTLRAVLWNARVDTRVVSLEPGESFEW